MKRFRFKQKLQQLEKQKGGYYFLMVDAKTVDTFTKKRATRLLCIVDEQLEFSCGLNHLGDGNFFIILATRHIKSLGKKLGDFVTFEIFEHPNPLGVDLPEVLTVMLDQDNDLKLIFDGLTDGKKRSLIFMIDKIKDVDKQVSKVTDFLIEHKMGIPMKKKKEAR